MNNETHTPEPWAAHPTRVNRQTEWIIYGDSKEPRGDLAVGKLRRANYSVANARRIVACVNACAGVSIKELEKLADITQDDIPGAHGVALMAITNIDLSEVNDELAEALRTIESLEEKSDADKDFESLCVQMQTIARAALAKLK